LISFHNQRVKVVKDFISKPEDLVYKAEKLYLKVIYPGTEATKKYLNREE